MRTRQGIALPTTLLAGLAILTYAAPSVAAGPTFTSVEPTYGDPEPPGTWEMTLPELKAVGLGQYRGDAIPVPDDLPSADDEGTPDDPQEGGGPAGVIFVNFDGAQLSSGSDSSQNNVTQIGQLAGSFAAYGDGDKRTAVMQAVATDWADFNVLVTQTRPNSGDYTMNMTGPTNPFGGGVLGIAPLDCNDQQTHNNITYAFHSENDSHSATVTATTIGQEVAHSYGLEHVDEASDVMNPFNAGGDASFMDTCIQIVQGNSCGAQHAAECGSSSMQNSYQELMTLFGPSTPDTSMPSVQIVSPNDGQEFAIGSDFMIDVEANDDVGIQQLVLFNNGAQVETDGSEPWGWEVGNAPEGDYEFYVEATDLAGNVAQSNIVSVVVTSNPAAGDDGDGDGDGGEGDGSGGGEGGGSGDGDADGDGGGDGAFDGGASDSGALPGQYGQNGVDGEGCSCRAPSQGGKLPPSAWMLVLALGAIRRRARD